MRLNRALRDVAAILIATGVLFPGGALGASQSVTVFNFAFSPANATVNVGESVTWTNRDPVDHTATSDSPGAFNAGVIPPGGSKTIQFSVAGTYPYHCAIHPSMTGTIIVAGATTTAPPTPTPPPPTAPPTPRPTPPPTAPPTAPPTVAPTVAPTPTPSPSASPSPSESATAAPSSAAIASPTNVAAASPSASTAAGPDLGTGPGPMLAAGAVVLAAALAGLALFLYRRR